MSTLRSAQDCHETHEATVPDALRHDRVVSDVQLRNLRMRMAR